MVEEWMPYAQAVYEIAKETKKEEEFLKSLRELSQIWNEEKEFVLALSHPKIAKATKKEWLLSLFEKELDPILMQTLLVFNEHGVIQALAKITEAFETCYQEDHDIQNVLVKSACVLDPAQEASLKKMLEKKLNKEVTLSVKIEPELIAGLRVQAGDLVLDNTVLSRLEAIKEKIKN